MRHWKSLIPAVSLLACLTLFTQRASADAASAAADVSSLQSAMKACEGEIAALSAAATEERHQFDSELASANSAEAKAINAAFAADSEYSAAKSEAARKPKDSTAQQRVSTAAAAVTAARADLTTATAARRSVQTQQSEASRKANAIDGQVNSKRTELNNLRSKLSSANFALGQAQAKERADAVKPAAPLDHKDPKAGAVSEKVNASGARIQKTRTSGAPAPIPGYSDDWYWKLSEFNPPDYIWEWTDYFAGVPKTGGTEPAVPIRDSSSPGWDFKKNPPEENISRGPNDQTKVLQEPDGMPPQPGAGVYSTDGSKPTASSSSDKRELAKLFSGLSESGDGSDSLSGTNAKGEKVPWSFNGSGIGTGANGEKIYNAYVGGKLIKTSQRDPNVVTYDPSGMPVGSDGLVVEYATLNDRDYSVNVVQKEIAEVRAEEERELRMMFPELYMSPQEIEQKRQDEEADRASKQKWAKDLRASGKPLTATEKYQLYQIEGGNLTWREQMKLGTDSMAEIADGIRKRSPQTEQDRQEAQKKADYLALLKQLGFDEDGNPLPEQDEAAPTTQNAGGSERK